MLRIGFLPSDYNPMVLILGEIEDMRLLAGALRRFAREQTDLRLDEQGFCTAVRTEITVSASPGAPGIQPVADAAGGFVWRLDAERASAFADQIDTLAVPSRAAGSEMLECTTEEEIPVKVSRGEYTDDFLAIRAPKRE
ncbi:MAG TPA: hypothetical protein VNW90_20505 [Acetobacteraceae bacterium]|jgi:hypothetical protein|nr:hypothetical protein [Acetobacteraceae bacterium]